MPSRLLYHFQPLKTRHLVRCVVTSSGKKEGQVTIPSQKYAERKQRPIAGHEDAVQESWLRLLKALQKEINLTADDGVEAVPEIEFVELSKASERFRAEHQRRGVTIVRNVVPEAEALQHMEGLQSYICANHDPHSKASPPSNLQASELYWSPSQVRARGHPNLLRTQRFLMGFWHSKDPTAPISTAHPTAYADGLRLRQPRDDQRISRPNVDGGSVERWAKGGYGLSRVYEEIWQGKWEDHDPWESSCRLPVNGDLDGGAGACSMFRMYQGWLSLTHTGPLEGSLLVNPLLGTTTAYRLLRPFFSPRNSLPHSDLPTSSSSSAVADYLSPSNWRFDRNLTTTKQSASQGHSQEITTLLRPHKSTPNVAHMRPGDYIAWHCDTIHPVDAMHIGRPDSFSLISIPVCPLTESNAAFLARQRHAFLNGHPGPDAPDGEGEAKHVGRPTVDELAAGYAADEVDALNALRSMGLEMWDGDEEGTSPAEREVMNRANKILGFYD